MLEISKYAFFELLSLYDRTFKHGDSRVERWLFMQSPLPTIGLCLAYVYIVKFAGPSFMKCREPYNIRVMMVAYNFSMVLLSLYMFIKLGLLGWFGHYDYKCQPVDYSNSVNAIEMANLSWWYYISKYFEFVDTIFFVLRKKFSHISTLHVIHHGVMPMSVWWGVKFTPGGHSTFFAFVNSFIHIIMYIYYGLSAIGPHMNRYLWWKKYMTSIQMIQFVLIFVHSFQLLFRECNYPRGFMWWIGFHAVLFWFLFWDFYKNAYKCKRAITGCGDSRKKVTFKSEQILDRECNNANNGESIQLNGYHCESQNDLPSQLSKRKKANKNGINQLSSHNYGPRMDN